MKLEQDRLKVASDNPVQESVAMLHKFGMATCRITPGTKQPFYLAWPTFSMEPEKYGPNDSVGIIGGPISGFGREHDTALVIIDLDNEAVLKAADDHLPATGMIEGRPSKWNSHRYYLVPLDSIPEWAFSTAEQSSKTALENYGHPGPFIKSFAEDDGHEAIRFIGTGGQTVCPPSLHPSGEKREWKITGRDQEIGEPGIPATVSFSELWYACCDLAVACNVTVPQVEPRPASIQTTIDAVTPAATASTFKMTVNDGPNDVERAIEYLSRCDPAIQGAGGSDACMWAARCAVYGYNLGEQIGFQLLRDFYNPRCKPEWSERELKHKCKAANKDDFKKHPRGWLRDTENTKHVGGDPVFDAAADNIIRNMLTPKTPPNLLGVGCRVERENPTSYIPFPTHVLPQPFGEFVTQGAKALCCDDSLIALPLLSAIASAIGNRLSIRVAPMWIEPSVFFTATVAGSGQQKSPAMRLAIEKVEEQEAKLHHDYNMALSQVGEGDEPPTLRRALVGNTTIEALICTLADNPAGVLNPHDELAGWFESHTRYKGKSGGSDESNWLSIFNAGSASYDRKTGTHKHVYVPHAYVSVTGSIQPGVLKKYISRDRMYSGMAARIIYAMPPKRQKVYSEEQIDPALDGIVRNVFEHIFSMQPKTDLMGVQRPHVVELTPEAHKRWKQFVNEWGAEQYLKDEDMSAAYSKLEAYAARFALLHHAVSHAIDREGIEYCQLESIEKGIEFVQWAAYETERVYSMLATTEVEGEANNSIQQLARIQQRRGKITPRDLQQSYQKRYPTAEAAKKVLEGWVEAGRIGRHQEGGYVLLGESLEPNTQQPNKSAA